MEHAQTECPSAQHHRLLFDDHGHLTPLRHQQVRSRLNDTGHWSPMYQSELLAKQLDYPDHTEIWAVLMWNERPCPALAAKLRRWCVAGMPLPGCADGGMAPVSGAS